jgi:hypothetical protein
VIKKFIINLRIYNIKYYIMKKLIVLSFLLSVCIGISISQTYKATLSIDDVDISDLKPGDDVIVPIRFVEISGGKFLGFQLFVGFDHNILSWKGTAENPLPGIRSLNPKMSFEVSSWIFNDNSNQMAGIWSPPGFDGLEFKGGELILEYIFTYKGGLQPGEVSPLIWGDTFEMTEGIVKKGPTEIVSEKLDNYVLTLINGSIKN